MKNSIMIGVALGLIVGACLTNNCCSVRNVVEDTQQKLVSKLKSKGEKIMSKVDNSQCEFASDFSGSCQCDCMQDEQQPQY